MTDVPEDEPLARRRTGHVRWTVCALLFAAVVLSYIDRLVLPVLKPDLQHRYGWTETGYADLAIWFQAAYGLSYLMFGRLVDRFGARIGYAVAVGLWTVGHVGHIFFTSTRGLLIARLPLAIGEAGTFPAALAAANEWFPKRERALAIGIFNAGANAGAIITPLIVPAIALRFGWRMAFVATGALSVLWLIAWLTYYRSPTAHRRVGAAELDWIRAEMPEPTKRARIGPILRRRQTWAYALARFLIDPVWWTFLFWLPDFFNRQFGIKMMDFGPPLVAVYLLSDLGSIGGGWLSSTLIARGVRLGRARKTAMFVAACCAIPIAFAAASPTLWVAVLLIGLACAGHQAFSANAYAMPGDLFPPSAVGTVVGIGGLAGAAGGMLMAKFAGIILQTVGSFRPIFIVASCAYLAALVVVHLLVPRYDPAGPALLASKS